MAVEYPLGNREGTYTAGHAARWTAKGGLEDAGAPTGGGTVDAGIANAVAFYVGTDPEVSPSATVKFLEAAHALLLQNTFISIRLRESGIAANAGGLIWFISNGDGSWSWAYNTAVAGDFTSRLTFITFRQSGITDFYGLTLNGATAVAPGVLALPAAGYVADNGVAPKGVLGSGYLLAKNPVLTPQTFASLPGSPTVGTKACISDSNTQVWGATIAGGGGNSVLAWYNGSNWTVYGK